MKFKKEVIVLITFMIIFVVLACFVYQNNKLSESELNIINFVQNWLREVPLQIPVWITGLVHTQMKHSVIALVTILLFIGKKYKDAILFLCTFPVLQYVYSSLKLLINRPRPPEELRLIHITKASFPSGHSVISMVLYGLLIFFVCKYVKNRALKYTLVSLLSLLILMIGFTRVWLGVHYPTDVIGGFSLGICFLAVFSILSNIVQK